MRTKHYIADWGDYSFWRTDLIYERHLRKDGPCTINTMGEEMYAFGDVVITIQGDGEFDVWIEGDEVEWDHVWAKEVYPKKRSARTRILK